MIVNFAAKSRFRFDPTTLSCKRLVTGIGIAFCSLVHGRSIRSLHYLLTAHLTLLHLIIPLFVRINSLVNSLRWRLVFLNNNAILKLFYLK